MRALYSGILLLLGMAASASAEDFDPYQMPKAYFSERVKTIALAPLFLPSGPENPAAIRQSIESRIRASLEAKGYKVIPSAVYMERWVGYSEKLGGVFDPVTGETKEEIWDTAYEHTTRALRRSHDIDAVLFPRINLATLPVWVGYGVFLAGNEETVTWKGTPLQANAYNRPQRVVGTHLGISIRDPNAEVMYGVQFPIEVSAVYVASGFEEKPADHLYRNDAWLQKAVDTVTGYLPQKASESD